MVHSLSAYMALAGGLVLLVKSGPHDSAEMFKHANQALTFQTWLFHLFGFFIIYLVFHSLMQPLSVCADAVPFISDLMEVGNSCLSFFLAGAVLTNVVAVA
jgi:hypothetical protein